MKLVNNQTKPSVIFATDVPAKGIMVIHPARYSNLNALFEEIFKWLDANKAADKFKVLIPDICLNPIDYIKLKSPYMMVVRKDTGFRYTGCTMAEAKTIIL